VSYWNGLSWKDPFSSELARITHADGSRLRTQCDAATGAGTGHDSSRSPKSNRVDPWRYDRALYRKRNEIERLFRGLDS
jgi:hypothetical protein